MYVIISSPAPPKIISFTVIAELPSKISSPAPPLIVTISPIVAFAEVYSIFPVALDASKLVTNVALVLTKSRFVFPVTTIDFAAVAVRIKSLSFTVVGILVSISVSTELILIVSTPAKTTVPASKSPSDFKVKSNTSASPVAFAKVTVVVSPALSARTVSPTPAATFSNSVAVAAAAIAIVPISRALNVYALCLPPVATPSSFNVSNPTICGSPAILESATVVTTRVSFPAPPFNEPPALNAVVDIVAVSSPAPKSIVFAVLAIEIESAPVPPVKVTSLAKAVVIVTPAVFVTVIT